MRKKVLITGFDPFGQDQINPALEAVKRFKGRIIEEVEVVTLEVPTVFHESIKVVIKAIELHQPDVVICVGQAGGRTQITPERVAINIDDARIPDNHQKQPIDEAIVENGPVAYWSTLPIKRIVHNMKKAGIPSAVSNSAGTFFFNHLFYGVMNYIEKNTPHIRGGFIHIPFIPEQ
ncbi:pyroglutamyl-peptidase I, partial [Heyndrickxia sporothermodurans]